MIKAFGLEAELHGYPWNDSVANLKEEIDGIAIEICDSIMTVRYDNEQDKARALLLAKLYGNS